MIGYTTGVFDLFHVGHLNILRNASLHCENLIVAVTTDELAYKLKGKHPIIPFNERLQIVQSIKYVYKAIPEETDDKIQAYQRLKFDILFKGDDWKGSKKWNQLEELLMTYGVIVKYLPYTNHTSSTKLRVIIEAFEGDIGLNL